MIILQIIFWISFIALAHTYVIYPLLLKILAVGRDIKSRPAEVRSEAAVSILIAAYNEEKVIGEKLQSIFNSDYPQEKIEVLIGSDNSTDRTNEIIESLSKKYNNLHLVNFFSRSGKIKIINHLESLAKNEILILTDANVMFDMNTIKELTKHFSNPEIDLVDSNMINPIGHSSYGAKAESTYIRGEVGIKNNEGKVFGMMMGPFGGCYAVRKSFYSAIPENFLVDDFYINMKVLEKGGKAISEINAKVYEEVPSNWNVEFKRKIRIATGSYQNLFAFAHLLFRFNALSFCFLSHKVLRWKGPFLMIALYFIPAFGVIHSLNQFYNMILQFGMPDAISFASVMTEPMILIFLFENLLLLILIFDLLLSLLKISSPTRLITHFFSTNLALLIGFFKFLGGVKSSVWQPTKR